LRRGRWKGGRLGCTIFEFGSRGKPGRKGRNATEARERERSGSGSREERRGGREAGSSSSSLTALMHPKSTNLYLMVSMMNGLAEGRNCTTQYPISRRWIRGLERPKKGRRAKVSLLLREGSGYPFKQNFGLTRSRKRIFLE